jgi:hypothetical protein
VAQNLATISQAYTQKQKQTISPFSSKITLKNNPQFLSKNFKTMSIFKTLFFWLLLF